MPCDSKNLSQRNTLTTIIDSLHKAYYNLCRLQHFWWYMDAACKILVWDAPRLIIWGILILRNLRDVGRSLSDKQGDPLRKAPRGFQSIHPEDALHITAFILDLGKQSCLTLGSNTKHTQTSLPSACYLPYPTTSPPDTPYSSHAEIVKHVLQCPLKDTVFRLTFPLKNTYRHLGQASTISYPYPASLLTNLYYGIVLPPMVTKLTGLDRF